MNAHHWVSFPQDGRLGEAEVAVWWVPLNPGAEDLRRLEAVLGEDERARASRFYFDHLKRRFTVARGALRMILARFSGQQPEHIIFGYAQHGKPFLPGSRLHFNVSHANELALIALSIDRQVGVDLEHIRPVPDAAAIARRFFSPTEVESLFSLPESEQLAAFYNCWTRKEAYIKAIGDGLTFPLDQFEVSLGPGETAELRAVHPRPQEVGRWQMAALNPMAGYAGALIAEGREWSLRTWQFQPDI